MHRIKQLGGNRLCREKKTSERERERERKFSLNTQGDKIYSNCEIRTGYYIKS